MPMLDPRQLPMPLTYARLMLRQLTDGADGQARLLEGTSITDADLLDPAAEVGLSDFIRVFENASRIFEPDWALGLDFDLPAQGALGFAMACAPTIGDSLDTLARYGHVRAPWFRLREFRDGDAWGVAILRQFPVEPDIDMAMMESVNQSAQKLIEAVLGQPMVEAVMRFDYVAPPWRDVYLARFSGKVVFEADFCGLSVPSAWRTLPCPLTDAGMYQASLARLESERRRLDSPDNVAARVAMQLKAAGDAGADLETIAARLNVSRRTLLRRLGDAGTSFGELRDAHAKARAAELLSDPNYSVAEVGQRLGYAEPANFTRAFRRWFGSTPRAFRQLMRGTAG